MGIFFVAGIPASGKTTFCREKENAVVFSLDDWLKHHYGEDNPFFLDDGAVDSTRRRAIVAGLKKRGVDYVSCIYLLCPMYEAAERNVKREWPISRDNFYMSCTRQEYPTEEEGFREVCFMVNGRKK